MRKYIKILGVLSMLLGLTTASLYLSVALHSFLSGSGLFFTLNMFELVTFVFTTAAIKFFGIFFILSVLYIVNIFWVQRIYNVSTEQRIVTPDIITPASSGNGEHGTAKWLPEKQFKKHFTTIVIPSLEEIHSLQERNTKVE